MSRDGHSPVPVEGNRNDLAARLLGDDGLLVGLDFDGTLAPIAEDPDAPTITPECRRALVALAGRPSATVAVVSGRALSDVKPRVGVPGVVYAGNHGLELERDGTREVHPAAQRRRPALERAVETVEERLEDVPGCFVEDKGLTATVHYRQAPRDVVDEVTGTVATAVEEEGEELSLSAGKESVEIRPAVDWDKGSAVRHLLDRESGERRALYVGDDETDEDAFRALGPDGVGILVGSREGSRADYRIPSQRAVAPLLRWLATDVLDETPAGQGRRSSSESGDGRPERSGEATDR